MNVVDSCGWLEFISEGPNAGFFAPPLNDVETLVVPSITVYEVFKRVLQQSGEADAVQALALMDQGMVVDLDSTTATTAAKLSVALQLPMADAIIVAVARAHGATLWTQDSHFELLEGVRYVTARSDPMA